MKLYTHQEIFDKVRIAVRWAFGEGHRWARMLGFVPLPEIWRIEGIWCAIYERSIIR